MRSVTAFLSESFAFGGHGFSAHTIGLLFLVGGIAAAIIALWYFVLVIVPKIVARRKKCSQEKRAAFDCTPSLLARPASAHLGLDTAYLESPRTLSPHSARTRGDAPFVRHLGPCWNGEYLAHVKARSRLAHIIVAPRVASAPEAPTPVEKAALHLAQIADDVVGAHPDAIPYADRVAAPYQSSSFPWVTTAGTDFKFGLVHTIDTTPVRVPVKVKKVKEDKPIVNWGTVTHTLALPLRGNKLALDPVAIEAKKLFVKKTHRRSYACDKENLFPASVDAMFFPTPPPPGPTLVSRLSLLARSTSSGADYWFFAVAARSRSGCGSTSTIPPLLPPTVFSVAPLRLYDTLFPTPPFLHLQKICRRTDHPDAPKPPPKRTQNTSSKVDVGTNDDDMGENWRIYLAGAGSGI
ncbi:hypothetical protein C8R43DRAFT_948443 [Mycena crocata]|nr:hypothetical protein C8R43DRAFT_948443 [Mycena crocata]